MPPYFKEPARAAHIKEPACTAYIKEPARVPPHIKEKRPAISRKG